MIIARLAATLAMAVAGALAHAQRTSIWTSGDVPAPAEVVPARVSPETAASAEDTALASALCDAVLKVEHFSGVVLIARGDAVLESRAVGLADRAARRENTLETLFDLGSVSKPITAIAVMRLVDRGVLGLDAPLSEVLRASPDAAAALQPSTDDDGELAADEPLAGGSRNDNLGDEAGGVVLAECTVRELLRHRSGIAAEFPRITQEMTRDRRAMLRGVAAHSLLAGTPDGAGMAAGGGRPGEYSYNNANYFVLAAVVEELARRSFEAELRDSVLQPAGVTGMWFVGEHRVPRDRGCDRHTSHRGTRGAPFVADHPHGWMHRGATGVLSSAPDVLRLARALRGGALLSPTSMDAMFRVDKSGDYALGWVVEDPKPGSKVVHHVGQTRGNESLLAIAAGEWSDPSEDLTIIVLSNQQGTIESAWSEIRRVLGGQPGWGSLDGRAYD